MLALWKLGEGRYKVVELGGYNVQLDMYTLVDRRQTSDALGALGTSVTHFEYTVPASEVLLYEPDDPNHQLALLLGVDP